MPRNSPISLWSEASAEADAGETLVAGDHATWNRWKQICRVAGCLACGQTVTVFRMMGPPAPQGETCLKRLCISVRSFVTNDM